jgi:DUF971 family protein
MSETPQPVSIKLDKPARRLVIDWADGVRTSYPWPFLRANCPSAGERVARENPNPDPLAVLPKMPSHEIVEIRPVGSYAIGITWADGHSAGIYTWDYLNQLADDEQVETIAIA